MKIHESLDKDFEAYALFVNVLNGSFIDHYSINVDTELKLIIDDLYTEAKVLVDKIKSKTLNLNAFIQNKSYNQGAIILIPFTIRELLKESVDYNPYKMIKELSIPLLEGEDLSEGDDLFDFVNNLSMETSDKWNFISILKNPDIYIDEINMLINSLKPLIDKYELIVSDRINTLARDWEKLLNNSDKLSFFSEKFGVVTSDEVDQFYFSLVLNNAIMFIKEKSYIGLHFTQEYFDNSNINNDNIVDIMKVLGDVSKYNILRELLSGRKYGRELANNLDLSAATISYHIQDMVNAGLLYVDSDDKSKRVYYEIRKTRLKDALDFLLKEFDLKED